MATEFRRTARGIEVRLSSGETDAVVQVLGDVRQLLADDAPPAPAVPDWAAELGLDDLGVDPGADPTPPADAALARLLPSATGDEHAAKDFRRLTERGLRGAKLEAISVSLEALRGRSAEQAAEPGNEARPEVNEVVLDDRQAVAFSRALTDVRLVMAQRLGIETEEDADAVHDWLGEHADDDLQQPGESHEEWQFRLRAQWLAQLYDFLTWLQESLSGVLLAALPEDGDGRRQPPPLSDGD